MVGSTSLASAVPVLFTYLENVRYGYTDLSLVCLQLNSTIESPSSTSFGFGQYGSQTYCSVSPYEGPTTEISGASVVQDISIVRGSLSIKWDLFDTGTKSNPTRVLLANSSWVPLAPGGNTCKTSAQDTFHLEGKPSAVLKHGDSYTLTMILKLDSSPGYDLVGACFGRWNTNPLQDSHLLVFVLA